VPIFQDAIQHALVLLRERRLRLDELCTVMALYGARTLEEEPPAPSDASAVDLIEALMQQVVRGEGPSELLYASELIASVAGIDYLKSEFPAPGTGTRIPAMPDGPDLRDDPQDLGAGVFATPAARRLRPTHDAVPAVRIKMRTRLAQFLRSVEVEPSVNPGLDKDAPSLDGPGLTQFALGDAIGEGGAGRVLLGVDRDLRRAVAIKTLQEKHRNNPLQLQSFIEEAIITGGLEHPNIVPVYQMGYSDELGPYYVMKRLEGLTLGDVLQGLRRGDPGIEARYDLDRLLGVLIEASQAIGYAHDRRVIHCDLKPNNLLLGHYGEVHVVDWGLACVMGDPGALQARAQLWSGTPGFMAPEQVVGDPSAFDARTDVWALGGILYAMLTLTRPIVGRSRHEVLEAVMRQDVEPPSRRAPDRRISPDLDRICLTAMARRPEDRYPSVPAFIADLEQHLAGRRHRRERLEHAQRALDAARSLLDEASSSEAVVDALQQRILGDPDRARQAALREDLQDVRGDLLPLYEDATRTVCEALEAGATHAPLESLVGDLYWRVFKRLHPARVASTGVVPEVAGALLMRMSAVALEPVASHARRLADQEAAPSPAPEGATGDPWLDAVLAFCGPQATDPDADRLGAASRLGARLAFLRTTGLLAGLRGVDLVPVAEACERVTYPDRAALFLEGAVCDAVYLVTSGAIDLVRGGARVGRIEPGGSFGELAVIDDARLQSSAVAVGATTALRIPAARFMKLLNAHGTIATAVLRMVTSRIRTALAARGTESG
jgi:serine/threonine protein kinase